MSVDRREVERIARLAHLHLEDEEADRLTEEMNRILDYVSQLGGDEGTEHAGADADSTTTPAPQGGNVSTAGLRGTRAAGGPGRPDPLSDTPDSFAPRYDEGFFVVPAPPGVVPEGSEGARAGGTPGRLRGRD